MNSATARRADLRVRLYYWTRRGVRWLAAELPEELGLPCCLVKLGVPLLEDPGAASWLDDTERCVSWALVDANAPDSDPEVA